MTKRLLLACLAAILFLTACGNSTKPQKKVVIYFANASGTDLAAVDLDVNKKSAEELPRYVIEKLLEGPTDSKMSRAIPSETKLLSVTTENALVKVDFSKEFYHEEGIYDILAIASVVKSLCSINGVEQVLITVVGEPFVTTGGKVLGILTEGDIVFDADALAQDEEDVTLYFSDLNAEYLVPEIRRVKVRRGEALEKLVVQELIAGPKTNQAGRTVPQETKIRSIEIKDNVCFVNLSSEFVSKNMVGSTAERLIIYSIVNSLTELSGIDKVQFLIEGEKRDVYKHMFFNEPFSRDVSMIQK